MNFKKIALSSVLALGSLFVAGEAQARTCFDFGYGSLCNERVGNNRAGQQIYHVGYANGREELAIKVLCDGRNMIGWTGTKRNMTEGQARWVASEFCALPNQ